MAKKKAGKKKTNKISLKNLSDWQLARVRNALRAYHRYERDPDGAYFTWKDVREAIAIYTGVEIGASAKLGAERLRQFVEGVEAKDGEARRFPAPQPKALEAIIAFVTHVELDLLSSEELSEETPGTGAPMRMLEFMRTQSVMPQTDQAYRLEGQYTTRFPDKDGWGARSLFFQRSLEHELWQVIEVRNHYITESKDRATELALEMARGVSEQRFSGWALLTPEDSLILFMKDQIDGRNHRYLCLEDVGIWLKHLPTLIGLKHSSSPKILMMEHEFGHDLRGADIAQITEAIRGDVLVFEKISGPGN